MLSMRFTMKEILLGTNGGERGIGLGDIVDGVRFYGSVSPDELITNDALALEVGITVGSIFTERSPWLHFELDGVTLYVAQQTHRYAISYNQLNARGVAVGETTILITGNRYKVRLLSSIEWDRLIPSVHDGNHTNNYSYDPPPGPWPIYSDAMLNVGQRSTGQYTWCMGLDGTRRLWRGYDNVLATRWYNGTHTSNGTGWRPVLELVE